MDILKLAIVVAILCGVAKGIQLFSRHCRVGSVTVSFRRVASGSRQSASISSGGDTISG
ncbi:hypothetical protein [Paraburkholderia sp. RAU2J]|uniref:hypothetical protein n=1 Tax=Paraburkholderia sp. RAU2J TaxID=1938810 RepID=UPI0018F4616D